MDRLSFDFRVGTAQQQSARELSGNGPFRIAVLGDLSGRASRGDCEPTTLRDRPLLAVDVDNFEEVLARVAPEVHVPLSSSGAGVSISIRTLDDFHPDSLYDRLEVFSALRVSRRRLLDPEQCAGEAARLRLTSATKSGKPPDAATPWTGSNSDLLNAVLAQEPLGPTPSTQFPPVKIAGVDLARLVEEAVAPFVLPKADPRQAEFVAAVDEAIAEMMRRILHSRVFQSLEAAWRQLWRVTKALTTNGEVRLLLLDVTREEIAADLSAAGPDIVKAGLYQLLVDRQVHAPDGQPWGSLVLLEQFGRSIANVQLLGALGAVASMSGGSLLADASPDVVGLPSWGDAADDADWNLSDVEAETHWSDLRTNDLARSIGLAAPHPLIRLPYGSTNSTARFAFDELGPNRPHASMLWGSAALACAELLGLNFLQNGWSMRPGQVNDLEDLPPCLYEEHGEKLLQPSAEIFLTERVGEALGKRGVIPLQSYKNRHAIRVQRFVSLTDPATPLTGPWH